MIRHATIAALGALLLAAPSFATDAKAPQTPAVSAAAPAVQPVSPRRRTTLERWRGGPTRLVHSDDTLIRQEALNKALPIATQVPNLSTIPHF